MSGDIQLYSSLVLKDVLFVPQFNCNLLSISALIKNTDLIVSFFENHFIIQDPTTKKMIGKGERLQDLYILQMNTKIKNTITPVSVNSISVQIWHNILGHLSFQRLTDMQSQIPIDVSKCNNAEPCHVCPLAKQKRLPFVSNNHLSQSPFDLIHCDVWGPFHVIDRSGHKYFVTLVDDCSRFTWVFLLK